MSLRMTTQSSAALDMAFQNLDSITNKKVMIVEDDEFLANVIEEVVFQLDPSSSIETCDSGEDALIKISESKKRGVEFDIVYLDVFLRRQLTGIDVCQRIIDVCPESQIIMSSSVEPSKIYDYVGDQSNNQFLYLKKPFFYNDCYLTFQSIFHTS